MVSFKLFLPFYEAMNASEKFCLKWKDFQENVQTTLRSIREDNEFSDVTLVCEDGHQLEAHKVILASSSPFFQNILKKSKHAHPYIYMRGMKPADLLAILDFLYDGEANIYQENLDSFLSIAEELKLKGLTGASDAKDNDVTDSEENKQGLDKNDYPENKVIPTKVSRETKYPIQEFVSEKNVSVLGYIHELDAMITSRMTKGKNNISNGKQLLKSTRCNICGKEGKKSTISDHIEANHIVGFFHSCKICGKTFRTRHGLRLHSREHLIK